jgi:hypothetical protein
MKNLVTKDFLEESMDKVNNWIEIEAAIHGEVLGTDVIKAIYYVLGLEYKEC